MKEHPYNPYTRAYKNQELARICSNCGSESYFWRERGHQHWRPSGRETGELVEINGKVYIKCICGTLITTRLKPMSASMPHDYAVQLGLLEK